MQGGYTDDLDDILLNVLQYSQEKILLAGSSADYLMCKSEGVYLGSSFLCDYW